MHAINLADHEKVKAELEKLDQEHVELDGKKLKPSQCYRLDLDPLHILFNTNCPDALREKVQTILSRYTVNNEGSTS